MKNIILKKLAIVVLIGSAMALPAYTFAQSVPPTGGDTTGGADTDINSSSTIAVPPTAGDNTGGADTNTNASTTVTVPPTGGGDTGGADTNTNASSTITVPPMGGGNTGGADTATTTTSTTTTTTTTGGGGTGSVSFSGGGGGGSGLAFGGVSTTTATTTSTIASSTASASLPCPFLTGYVIPGQTNNPADIEKLQVFLSTYEHDKAVTVTGVLDQATLAGIIAFQTSYLSTIMGPWGVVTPSGQAYITTLKQINNIVCASPLTLDPADIAIINAYKASVAAGNNGTSSTTASTTGTIGGSTGSSTAGSVNGNGTPNNSLLTGNVVSSGAGAFFGNLFTKIFKFFGAK